MSALTDARHSLLDELRAAGLHVLESVSKGHVTPPAVLVTPGPEWVQANAQMGNQLHSRMQLQVSAIAGKVASEQSLVDLEALVEQLLGVLAPRQWTLTAIGQPYALSIAGTEYLACSATLTRQVILGT